MAGRPQKRGIDYFPHEVGMLDDPKVNDLLDRHGPIGYVVYIAAVEIIYADGYWAELNNQLILSIVKKIGSKWIKDREVVKEVIDYCACCGLFDRACEQQNVLTSPGIQRRYLFVKKRNSSKYDIKDYCLLSADDKASLLPLDNIAAGNSNIAAGNSNIAAGNDTKKRKEKESKVKREIAPERFSHSQRLFHETFPGKKIDIEIPGDLDLEMFINQIKASDFLKDCDNLSLAWCIERKLDILSGAYRKFKKPVDRNYEEHGYTREETNDVFADID